MKVTTEFDAVYNTLDTLFNVEYLNDLAEEIRDTIINNIQMNLNVYGETLEPYDPKYEKRKIKLGYGSGVNFTLFGSLMRNMVYRAFPRGFEIYIRDRAKNPNNQKMIEYGTGNHKNWNVFSWEGIIKATLMEEVNEYIDRMFNRS